MTTLYLITPLETRPIAQGFAPDDLPAAGILWDWIRAARNGWTVAELQGKLETGQPFAFGDGMLVWRAE